MNVNFKGVGERIAAKIKEQKLKQIDVARATGISKNAISNYINGNRIPDTESIYKLATFFSVSIEWLLIGEKCYSTASEILTASEANTQYNTQNKEDKAIIQKLLLLNERQKGKIEERIDMLLLETMGNTDTIIEND
ncbi:helix-turn-helix domain-containing protein [Bacillus ndiopicus]|uniref:helix-turn-helix domain-containing protein n=1 Tax=Bacillus ndiopicus TaxID=1347368 RepID=UPI0006948CE7|nr:helix-turn-helix transcriptional regulator [Bacillus ndiopicus]